MTKKHFNRAVQIVSGIQDKAQRDFAAVMFASLFREFNPRFNSEKFMDACGIGRK